MTSPKIDAAPEIAHSRGAEEDLAAVDDASPDRVRGVTQDRWPTGDSGASSRAHRSRLRTWASSGFAIIVMAVVVMWLVEIIDTVLLDDWLQGGGIHPRRADGLDGIVWAPLLHSDFAHVFSNTVPLLVMGGLVSVRGFRYWAIVTGSIVVVGGFFTWLLAGGTNHVGASGVVFGYFGALLSAAWFERKPATLGAALLAIFLYSGIVALGWLVLLSPSWVPKGDSWDRYTFPPGMSS